MVKRGYKRINEDIELILFEVTKYVVFVEEMAKIEKFQIGLESINPSVPSKVLMFVGQTGAGKSTLINAIVNYIFDIKWEDTCRLVLIPESSDQTQSQTQSITAYSFHLVTESTIPFKLTIIDTPGFGDTQGLERDKRLVDQIKAFFSAPSEYGIDHLDGIAFTVKASDNRLTHTQRYIFNAVMSLFGKDVESNIFIMATHADGKKSKVFEALNEAGIPTDKKFMFNNSALFTPPRDATNLSKIYWEMGVSSIQLFLSEFQQVESKSLTLTKKVLKERKQLEVCIKGLQEDIRVGVSKISCLKQEKKLLREYKKSIHASKNFTYVVAVEKQRVVDCEVGQFVTNCIKCNRTCHYPCTINRTDEKHLCAAMKPQNDPINAACTICPGKCSWKMHENTPKRYETYSEKEERTYEDLLARYKIAIDSKDSAEKAIERISAEKHKLQNDVLSNIKKAHACIQTLEKIALKPNPLSQVQYIELLIQAEKSDTRPGWQNRVYQYERAKEAAELMFHIKDQTIEEYLKENGLTDEDLSDYDDDVETSQSKKKSGCPIS